MIDFHPKGKHHDNVIYLPTIICRFFYENNKYFIKIQETLMLLRYMHKSEPRYKDDSTMWVEFSL